MEEIILRQKGIVECDFEAIKAHLNEQLDIYSKMVFTEDSKKEAKNTVAELRKEQKAFDDRVKAVKKEYMKPYEEFFEKASEVSEMFNTPISFINGQVAAFEEKRIKEKIDTIHSIYFELVPDNEPVAEFIPLNIIYNNKWENATFKEKDIREEIMTLKIKVKDAIATINAMGSEKCPEAIEMYKRNFDLTECILFINNYEKQKAEIMAAEQARIQREAEERIRNEERAKYEAEQRRQAELQALEAKHSEELEEAVKVAETRAIEVLIPSDIDDANATPFYYQIYLTEDGKAKLEMYMDSVGIEYNEMPM